MLRGRGRYGYPVSRRAGAKIHYSIHGYTSRLALFINIFYQHIIRSISERFDFNPSTRYSSCWCLGCCIAVQLNQGCSVGEGLAALPCHPTLTAFLIVIVPAGTLETR